MIIFDKDSDNFRINTLKKWRQIFKDITEKQALFCEEKTIDIANNKYSKEIGLFIINEFLIKEGLIKDEKNI